MIATMSRSSESLANHRTMGGGGLSHRLDIDLFFCVAQESGASVRKTISTKNKSTD